MFILSQFGWSEPPESWNAIPKAYIPDPTYPLRVLSLIKCPKCEGTNASVENTPVETFVNCLDCGYDNQDKI